MKNNIKIINLPCYKINIKLFNFGTDMVSGQIDSELKLSKLECNARSYEHYDMCEFNGMINAVESLILAHACAGIDIEIPAYIEGIETTIESILNN